MQQIKLLVDTNIIVDYLNRREPFFADARKLMIAGRVGELSLWVSASQMSDLVYILSDGGKPQLIASVLERLRILRLFVSVQPVDADAVDTMLKTTWSNPEDALLLNNALNMKADAIISRDTLFQAQAKDYISVLNCSEFFEWLEDKYGVTYAEVDLL